MDYLLVRVTTLKTMEILRRGTITACRWRYSRMRAIGTDMSNIFIIPATANAVALFKKKHEIKL